MGVCLPTNEQRERDASTEIKIDNMQATKLRSCTSVLSANDIQNQVDEIFAKYDKDHDDNLDIDEMKWFLMEHDKLMDSVEVERKFEEIDLNANGYISRSELY